MNDKQFDILVVGELNVDLILNQIEGTPVLGKEVFSRDMVMTLGSSSAIFANNLSVLGTRVSFFGRVGQDNFADLVCSSLQKSGVDIGNLIHSSKSNTGITVAMSYGEDRAMVTYPGAMSDLTVSDIKDDDLRKAKHLHISSIFLQEGLLPEVHLLFARAKKLGLTTSLDPQWDPTENWAVDLAQLLPNVDIFLPNEAELMNMTGTTSIPDGMAVILPYCNHVVVKQGVKGATLYSEGIHIKEPAILNKNIVDAIGAGDSFNAGFIHAFLQDQPLTSCLETGIVTGAMSTTAAGGTGAFTSRKEVSDLAINKYNFKLKDRLSEEKV